jgi:hypothetical protein
MIHFISAFQRTSYLSLANSFPGFFNQPAVSFTAINPINPITQLPITQYFPQPLPRPIKVTLNITQRTPQRFSHLIIT